MWWLSGISRSACSEITAFSASRSAEKGRYERKYPTEDAEWVELDGNTVLPRGRKGFAMIKIATFNAENLFARFKFKGKRHRVADPGGRYHYEYRLYNAAELAAISKDGWQIDKTCFEVNKKAQRVLTAKAIAATDADIVCLQEVENLDVLRRFKWDFLNPELKAQHRDPYRYEMLVDGNDLRLIDIALLSRFPFDYVRSHQWMRLDNVGFSRDCLEVGFILQGEPLIFFINHFKSMIGGRPETMEKREKQTTMVTRIIEKLFSDPSNANFVVCGDFNDHRDYDAQGKGVPSRGLAPLLEKPYLVDVVYERLPLDQRWTHHYCETDEYTQLDYILLSRKLADANPGQVPKIVREGLPKRVTRFAGPRFDEIDTSDDVNLKASDHCPVAFEMTV